MAGVIDLSGTFDTTNALTSMFLWVIFGFLTATVNCDLQRMIQKQPLMLHAIGIISFFFLFTVLDSANGTRIDRIWLKTLFVYVLFVLLTKAKWYFVIPVVLLLLIDQTLKKDLQYREKEQKDEAYQKTVKKVSQITNWVIIGLIVTGSMHYLYLQKVEYQDQFSFYKFFVGTGSACKMVAPDYAHLRRISSNK